MHFFTLAMIFFGMSSAQHQLSNTHTSKGPATTCINHLPEANEPFPHKIAFQFQIGNLSGSGIFSIVDVAISSSGPENPTFNPTSTMLNTASNTDWVSPAYPTDYPH